MCNRLRSVLLKRAKDSLCYGLVNKLEYKLIIKLSSYFLLPFELNSKAWWHISSGLFIMMCPIHFQFLLLLIIGMGWKWHFLSLLTPLAAMFPLRSHLQNALACSWVPLSKYTIHSYKVKMIDLNKCIFVLIEIILISNYIVVTVRLTTFVYYVRFSAIFWWKPNSKIANFINKLYLILSDGLGIIIRCYNLHSLCQMTLLSYFSLQWEFLWSPEIFGEEV